MYIYDYSLTMIDFVDWLSSKERVFFFFFLSLFFLLVFSACCIYHVYFGVLSLGAVNIYSPFTYPKKIKNQ